MPEKNNEGRHEDKEAGDLIVMKRENVLVPKPRSNFLSVQCEKCNASTVIFSHTTTEIKCSGCGEVLATSSGSKARIAGKVTGTLDQ